MDRLFVHDAAESVLEGAIARAEAHRAPGKMLERVRMIVRGDRSAAALDFPLLGITRRAATPRDQSTFAITWEMPLRLTVQVVSPDTNEGFALANELAGVALHSMFTDPTMDPADPGAMTQELVVGPEVYGLMAGAVEPALGGQGENSDLYQARATVTAILKSTF